jgi:hypothetical protein
MPVTGKTPAQFRALSNEDKTSWVYEATTIQIKTLRAAMLALVADPQTVATSSNADGAGFRTQSTGGDGGLAALAEASDAARARLRTEILEAQVALAVTMQAAYTATKAGA